MQEKIRKWSKFIKWCIVFIIILRGLGISYSIPALFEGLHWTYEKAEEDLYERVDKYVIDDTSKLQLDSDAIKKHQIWTRERYRERVAEEIFLMILMVMGYIGMRKLSRDGAIDEGICKLIRRIGITIMLASVVIPSVGNVGTQLTIILPVDMHTMIGGFSCIVLGYILQHSKFLQDEYDMTL